MLFKTHNKDQHNQDLKPELLTRSEAAALLRIKPQTLACDVSRGKLGLPYIRFGGRALYRLSDVQQCLEKKTIVPNSER